MSFLKFDRDCCTLCGTCVEQCPFGAITMGSEGIEVSDSCRMCGLCVRNCPVQALTFEQKAKVFRKEEWKDFLIYAEQERGDIHPVTYELIGEARKMAVKVGCKVNCILIGPSGSEENAEKLINYGVNQVYVYEDQGFDGFRADCYTDAFADCISETKPCSVLIGATALGRSLAPRLSTRFHTGLTADCTTLDIQPNTDMVQIRPAFGGNIMAQIAITNTRPQFATVRYKVLNPAKPVKEPRGKVIVCKIPRDMTRSRIQVIEQTEIEKHKGIEEEEVLVVAGRGAEGGNGLELVKELALALDCQVAYTRPMVEKGYGDVAHQIGLSGRTVRPRLIITCGVSGAIQFTTCMKDADCIVAINKDPKARIFEIADICLTDDLNAVLPELITKVKGGAEHVSL